jgi:hypothetical protein
MGVVDTGGRALAIRLEEHEAAVWIDSVTAASELPGNPLHAEIDRSGPRPLLALCAVDQPSLNRVVALGVRAPARVQDVDAICAFYAIHGQANFRIEVTPFALPLELGDWITAKGLSSAGPGTFKIWRAVEPLPPVPSDIEVHRLGAGDNDAIAKLNVRAWGAFGTSVMSSWFGATVGRTGVHHYGVFEGDQLVATGSLFVSDGLGWFGFDATHPRHQGRTLRQAISAVRMHDAAALGCNIVHAESAIPPGARALRDWHLLYEKVNYSTVPPGAAASTTPDSETTAAAAATDLRHPTTR